MTICHIYEEISSLRAGLNRLKAKQSLIRSGIYSPHGGGSEARPSGNTYRSQLENSVIEVISLEERKRDLEMRLRLLLKTVELVIKKMPNALQRDFLREIWISGHSLYETAEQLGINPGSAELFYKRSVRSAEIIFKKKIDMPPEL